MDLGKYDLAKAAEEGAECVLRDPITSEATDAAITVVGSDSKAYRDASRKLIDTLNELRRAGKPTTTDDREKEAMRSLAAITVNWRNIALDGEELPFSKENAFRLYSDPRCNWVVEQLEAFSTRRASFFKG